MILGRGISSISRRESSLLVLTWGISLLQVSFMILSSASVWKPQLQLWWVRVWNGEPHGPGFKAGFRPWNGSPQSSDFQSCKRGAGTTASSRALTGMAATDRAERKLQRTLCVCPGAPPFRFLLRGGGRPSHAAAAMGELLSNHREETLGWRGDPACLPPARWGCGTVVASGSPEGLPIG